MKTVLLAAMLTLMATPSLAGEIYGQQDFYQQQNYWNQQQALENQRQMLQAQQIANRQQQQQMDVIRHGQQQFNNSHHGFIPMMTYEDARSQQ